MNKGMISALITLAFFLLPLAAFSQGQIYKIVDEDGNVTFTDQRPATGAEPMDLPPLSVIETDVQVPETPAVVADQEPKPPTSSELRKQFRDFAITQPEQEQTFWGTANTVFVSWGSSEAIPSEMSVMLFVDGKGQKAGSGC